MLRDRYHNRFVSKIGDGRSTNMWYDSWLACGPLCNMVAGRMIRAGGFTLHCSVGEFMERANGRWPSGWAEDGGILQGYSLPLIQDGVKDEVLWKNNDGTCGEFSSKQVWHSLLPNVDKVNWHDIVWHKNRIPKHAFIFWLAIRNGLATQEKLIQWKHIPPDDRCPFCELVPDSVRHLFFGCGFAKAVWGSIKGAVGIRNAPDDWDGVLDYIRQKVNKKGAKYSIVKLGVAAVIYHIWRERNRRIFENCKLGREEIIKRVMGEVRLKILVTKWGRLNLNDEIRCVENPSGVFG